MLVSITCIIFLDLNFDVIPFIIYQIINAIIVGIIGNSTSITSDNK